MEQTVPAEVGVAHANRLLQSLTAINRPLAGPRHTAAVVETHHNRNRQTARSIQPLKNLDAHIQIGSTFLQGIEIGEVGEITQMNLLETDSHANKAFGMAGISVGAAMELPHVVDLGDVVLNQPGHQLDHAGVGGGGSRLLDQGQQVVPALGSRQLDRGVIGGLGVQPTIEVGAAIETGHMHPDRIGVSVEADQQQIDGSPTAKAVFNGSAKILQATQSTRGRSAIITGMGCAAFVLGI